MKHSTKLFAAIILLLNTLITTAQTNVSGGIYTNTTWSKANSPYIVVDTVVVFPGVTLTIQPGVTVKFADGKYLEIRQGSFIAAGTASDSITFTSNSVAPTIGIYKGIVLNSAIGKTIDYCIFQYADNALSYNGGSQYVSIQHLYFYMNNNCLAGLGGVDIIQSSFYNNNTCIQGSPSSIHIKQSSFYNNTGCFAQAPTDCLIDNSTFTNNTYGPQAGDNCHVTNCIFLGNYSGLACMSYGTPHHFVQNCIFCNNRSGFFVVNESHMTNSDSLINCNFSHNGIAFEFHNFWTTGNILSGNILTDNDTAIVGYIAGTNNYIFHNKVGLVYGGGPSSPFSNNYICNNTLYNIIYTSSGNGSIPPICYCDTDSATIRSKIYDGYVNIARGLLNFTPFINCDSSVISSIPPLNCQTIITQVDEPAGHLLTEAFAIYPNPLTSSSTLQLTTQLKDAEVVISDMLGKEMMRKKLTGDRMEIERGSLESGVYFVRVNAEEKKFVQKIVVQ